MLLQNLIRCGGKPRSIQMVKRILNILNREYAGLHKAAYLLGAFAFLSQLLALVRDRLLAHYFGAGVALDVYYAAFRVPDLIYFSIASLVSVTVLIPFLAEKIKISDSDHDRNAHRFINSVFTVFSLAIFFVSFVVFVFSSNIADVAVPGFSIEQKKDFVTLMRILLLSPILLGLSSLLGSIVQVYRKFFVYASAPILYNLGIILGIVFLMPFWGIVGVAWGVIIGAFFHVLIQIPVVYKHGVLPVFTAKIHFAEIKKVIMLSLPRTIALSINQITLIVLIALASFMMEGSVAVFNFSMSLQSVPLSVIGMSYSIAAFPTLARLFVGNKKEEFIQELAIAARHIIFWATPIIVLFIVLRAQIVRSILGSGAFDWSDTRLVAAGLGVFSISIVAQSLQLLLTRAYYAAGETKIPVLVNVFSAIVIVVLAALFIYIYEANILIKNFFEILLRIEDVPGSAIVMLSLAYSIGIILNCGLLLLLFRRKFFASQLGILQVFMQIFPASVIMGFVSYQFLAVFAEMFNLNSFWGVFAQGLFSGIIGIFVGVLVLVLLGNNEIKEIFASTHNKARRKEVVAPDIEEL